MAITDSITFVNNLLTNNWTNTNTDNITPTIVDKDNVKEFGGLTDKDHILIYEGKTTMPINAIGAGTRNTFSPVSIDIWGFHTRARTVKYLVEVDRIIKANIVPSATYDEITDMNFNNVTNNKLVGIWHYVYDLTLKKNSEAM